MAGFIGAFVTFMILFFKFQTDEAMLAWIIAVPFIFMIVAGAVLSRIGDMLLRDFVEKEYQSDKKKKQKRKKGTSKWVLFLLKFSIEEDFKATFYSPSDMSEIFDSSSLNVKILFFPFEIAKHVKGSII